MVRKLVLPDIPQSVYGFRIEIPGKLTIIQDNTVTGYPPEPNYG